MAECFLGRDVTAFETFFLSLTKTLASPAGSWERCGLRSYFSRANVVINYLEIPYVFIVLKLFLILHILITVKFPVKSSYGDLHSFM